jgi:dephospho-CoA kinase
MAEPAPPRGDPAGAEGGVAGEGGAGRPSTIVGLTGGIGVGKSTAAGLLAAHGAHVVDVDTICKDVIEPGGPAHRAVLERFGPHLVGVDGRLDRAALASVVFGDPASLADLTAISHPAANTVMAAEVAAQPPGTVSVLDVAVLVEYPRLGRWAEGPGGGYEQVVVVEAPLAVRLERLVQQRGMTEADALARIQAQVDDAQRRRVADHVLDNGGDLAQLEAQVDQLWSLLTAA